MNTDTLLDQLRRTVPFARLLGIEILTIDDPWARARLIARPPLSNHVGTMHAGAVFTLCEAASGAAVAGALAEVVAATRFVVKDAHVEYLAPAHGDLCAAARLVDGPVLDTLRREGRAELAVDVRATTHGGEGAETLVARASFNWHLRLRTSQRPGADLEPRARPVGDDTRPDAAHRRTG